jgi:aryl-alcohol dehydrogenase-like predicted oxidoreductase
MKNSIKGYCTEKGSKLYTSQFKENSKDLYTTIHNLNLSGYGVGGYSSNIIKPISEIVYMYDYLWNSGCNVIDTASNYQDGISELAVGAFLKKQYLIDQDFRRGLFISTKAGLLSNSDQRKIKDSSNIILKGPHFNFEPEHFELSIRNSLARMEVATIDCIFIHNPEEILKTNNSLKLCEVLIPIIEVIESFCEKGFVQSWGISTWSGFTSPSESADYLSISDIYDMALNITGEMHNFKYIQIPFGLWNLEEILVANQTNADGNISDCISAARSFNLGIFSNSSLLQGEMLEKSIDWEGLYQKYFDLSHAQKILHITRSLSFADVNLVGMASSKSLSENIKLFNLPKLDLS